MFPYKISEGKNKADIVFSMKKLQGEVLYVQEVVTQPKILNRTILYNLVHVT